MLVGDVLVVHVKSQVKVKQEQEVYQVYRECRKWWFIMNVRDSRGRGYPAYKNDSHKKEGRTWHKIEKSITQIRRSYLSMRKETKDGQARGPWSDKY